MMKRFLLAYVLLTLLLVLLCGCSSVYRVSALDPRCQWNQYCPYTDPPPAIRTSVLRSGSYTGDPAAR
jgi:hypothetical protein